MKHSIQAAAENYADDLFVFARPAENNSEYSDWVDACEAFKAGAKWALAHAYKIAACDPSCGRCTLGESCAQRNIKMLIEEHERE